MTFLLALIDLFLPARAFAQAVRLPDCTNLIGCGQGPANILLAAIPRIAEMLLTVAGGLAVVMVIWCAMRLMTSDGDSGKLSQYRWGIIYSLLGVTLAVTSQVIVSFVVTGEFGQNGGGDLILSVLAAAARNLRLLVNAILAIVVLMGATRMVMASGKSEDYEKGKMGIIWAIAGAIVVNLSHALVMGVVSFFGG